VGIAEELGSVDQNRIPLPVNQSGVAVKPQITVKKDSKFKSQICSSFPPTSWQLN
jgi:hypothetical protein